jgi:hypothetical protein
VQDALQDLLSEPLTRIALNAISVCCKSPAPVQWGELRNGVFELQGLSEDSVRTRKVTQELSTFIQKMRIKLQTCITEASLIDLVNDLLAFLGRSSFRLRHERYLQNDFLNKTIKDCAAALADARKRRGT